MPSIRSLSSPVAGALALLALSASPGAAQAPRPAATRAEITAADLRARVGTLAHDSLRGREVGEPGAASAARYLAAESARMGLRPAGDAGSYLHRVDLVRRTVGARVEARTSAGPVSLAADGIVPVSGVGGLPGTRRRSGEGALVYGGHLIDPSIGADELRAQDLSGAVVMLRLSPAPDAAPGSTPRMAMGALFSPASPAAAILLVAGEGERELMEYAAGLAREGALEVRREDDRGDLPPFFMVTPEVAAQLLGAPLDGERKPRTGLGTLRYSLEETTNAVEAWNVVALLPGSDPARAGQMVALGAHYDHVGMGEPVEGDSIFNGADDDASGSAALLELAERFAPRPPARSLLFVWHTAEESGLIGSDRFTREPTVPRDSIVAQLNIDMLARNHPDSLFLVGSRRLSAELGDLVEEANRGLGRPFTLDYSLDAPDHPEMIYCRSDHYSYARFGIPVVFFTTGLHEDYHEPSDETETLDYEKLARATSLVGDVTRAVGDRAERLRVDRAPRPGECPM